MHSQEVIASPGAINAYLAAVVTGPADACWAWRGAVTEKGYGIVRLGNKKVRATHISLHLDARPRPDGATALHSCDNPPCCNPAHLRWGSNVDNNADMVARGRQVRGVRNGISKISDEVARAIRRAPGLHRDIADQFGLSRSIVSKIKRGELWGHV